jgi:hypothetical protein
MTLNHKKGARYDIKVCREEKWELRNRTELRRKTENKMFSSACLFIYLRAV